MIDLLFIAPPCLPPFTVLSFPPWFPSRLQWSDLCQLYEPWRLWHHSARPVCFSLSVRVTRGASPHGECTWFIINKVDLGWSTQRCSCLHMSTFLFSAFHGVIKSEVQSLCRVFMERADVSSACAASWGVKAARQTNKHRQKHREIKDNKKPSDYTTHQTSAALLLPALLTQKPLSACQ